MIPHPFRILALSTALAVVFSGGAMAQADPSEQTAPGVLIENTIVLSYDGADGVTIDLPDEDLPTASFTVARKIDLSVTAQASEGEVTVAPGQAPFSFDFAVRNLGNGAQGFNINVTNLGNLPNDQDTLAGLTYSTTVTSDLGTYYVLVNEAIYDVTGGTNAGNLDPGDEYTVRIVANIPIIATDGLADFFEVTAIALVAGSNTVVDEIRTNALDSESPNVVFADEATTWSFGGEPGDAETNGQDADRTNLRVTAPVLTATKTALVLSENLPGSTFNCATGGTATGAPLAAIPGACVEYTITIENTSTSETAAANISITDAIPGNTAYAGHTAGDFTVTTTGAPVTSVTADLATLAAEATASFTIRVLID
ncbi:hypothetical protein [Roseinatronobacter alkalisoli]|uniref:DUF11 domain-containing protein n=1 Tax=Roseinatronobacter alkalisoli TaxID=3028235 RepID=A0ABT5TCX4_9RHOB|nr:hypothetical protein [Roseinatronobacter sp. HJB301]MDD7972975.1 hypothetical protein [Roseinatronobacter sp. HJB301]